MNKTAKFKVKRLYDAPCESDGCRVLVDRLWPRGVTKEGAMIDVWAKGVAPSPAIRKWFNHEPDKFSEFSERYFAELHAHETEVQSVRDIDARTVTLIYAARDNVHNHAVILLRFLQ